MTISVDAALQRLFNEKAISDSNGNLRPVQGAISPAFADAITRVVRDLNPQVIVEIGMAYSTSTLAILRGLGPEAKLISIDPFQTESFNRAGKILVDSTDRGHQHVLIEEPDFLALPDLLKQGYSIDFAYIDGMHTFDYVLLDAFYLDKLVRIGGVIAFNDCGFRSIHKFLKFFRQHRHYEEFDVGLEPDYQGRNPLVSLWRQIEGRSNQDRYFRKVDAWEPEHNFFRPF